MEVADQISSCVKAPGSTLRIGQIAASATLVLGGCPRRLRSFNQCLLTTDVGHLYRIASPMARLDRAAIREVFRQLFGRPCLPASDRARQSRDLEVVRCHRKRFPPRPPSPPLEK